VSHKPGGRLPLLSTRPAVTPATLKRAATDFAGLRRRRAQVQIAVATLPGNSLRQTVHTHCASVHQAAKLVAAL